jgi:hypothetical protein
MILRALLCLILLASPQFLAYAGEEESPAGFSGEASLEAVTRYVWRAIPQSRAWAWQPNATLGYGSFYFNYFANYSNDDGPQYHKFTESDFALGWEGEVGKWTLSPSITAYTFPNTGNGGVTEIGGRVAYQFGFAKAFTSHYLSLAKTSASGGYYADFGLAYETELASEWKFSSSLALGISSPNFNNFNFGAQANQWAFEGVTLDFSAPYHFTKAFFAKPHLAASSLLNSTLKTALASGKNGLNKPNNFVAGFTLGADF